jgi:hypothetical protein
MAGRLLFSHCHIEIPPMGSQGLGLFHFESPAAAGAVIEIVPQQLGMTYIALFFIFW